MAGCRHSNSLVLPCLLCKHEAEIKVLMDALKSIRFLVPNYASIEPFIRIRTIVDEALGGNG